MNSKIASNSGFILFAITLILLSFNNCTETNPISNDEENPPNSTGSADTINTELSKSPIVHFDVNDFHLMIEKTGEIMDGKWLPPGGSQLGVIYSAGLWIATRNGGNVSANIIWCGTAKSSNYTANRPDSTVGVYYVPNNFSSNDGISWPVDYDAPVDADGNAKVYGDLMCWQSLTSDTRTNEGIFSNPIEGLRVNQAIYGYRASGLGNVIFTRYEITNLSGEDWTEVYAGFHTDTDLAGSYCNATGYNIERSLTFTYISDEGEYCEGGTPVTGFTFLETPSSIGVTAHRIMRKNNYRNPEFGEYDMNRPEQVLWALQGLDKYGQPMIDPITGEQTNFAFTGDPVTKTGWLDTPVDVRSILASGPFTLAQNESKVLTIVWIVTNENSISESIQELKSQLDHIKQNEELWKF